MRRRALVLAVLGLLASGAVACEPPTRTGTLTLRQTISRSRALDRGAPGPSVGDQIVFTATLRNGSNADVGTNHGFCTTVADAGSGGPPFWAECRESLSLADGHIDLQGRFGQTAYESGVAQVLSVTAGTGAWRNAHGTAQVTRTGATTSRLVVDVNGGGSSPATRRWRATGARTTVLDRGNPGRGGGDETLISASLRDLGGAIRGRRDGFCLTVADGGVPNVGPFLAECQESLTLDDGRIDIEGLVDESALDARTAQTIPIVGGTGRYRYAHGTVTLQKAIDGSTSVTAVLDPPTGCTPGARTFTEQGTQFYQVPDDDPARGRGDVLTSTSDLLDPSTARRVGRSYAYFLTVADGPGPPYVAQASQTLQLADGTVELGGVFNQTDFENFLPVVFAVNGGTGAYRRAHGTVRARQVVYPATFELTLHLTCDT